LHSDIGIWYLFIKRIEQFAQNEQNGRNIMKTILVIDDDPDLSDTIKSVLQYAGYRVLLSNNGNDGINKARIENPDLILLDIMMPNMDGPEVVTALTAINETCHIPVLFLSGLAVGLDVGEEETINVSGKKIRPIAKPFDNNKLLSVIDETLN
jgi:CheY-like chemotaxis protein